MDFIKLIFWIIGSILFIKMINSAFRLASRIAVATEASALHTAALFKTLSPKAQARANDAIDQVFAEVNAALAEAPAVAKSHRGFTSFAR
jgi:hypothetical protein